MRSVLALSIFAASTFAALPGWAQAQVPAGGPVPAAVAAEAASPAAIARLADRLARLDEDGLDPHWYQLPAPDLATSDPARYRAETMRAAQSAMQDLLLGRVAQLRGRADLRRDPAAVRLSAWVQDLATAAEPAGVIERAALLPPDARALKAELARYRALEAAGGWPAITGDRSRTLEPGATDPVRVPQLRARLAAFDPAVMQGAAATSPVYDQQLQAALKAFQAAEGLEADGRVGAITWRALAQPVGDRIMQLRVALDMRRGAPPPIAGRHIEVNIPHFQLRLYDGERVVRQMGVIVGRRDRQTPMLNVRMTTVQFNPQWGVPERNAREDLLPRFRRDPARMQASGFRLYQRIEGEVVEIDPTTVDFSSYSRTNFPYYIRQDAGDRNALGRIKFVMPNGDDIYMHDTPDRHLFSRGQRAFSSGCIRLERPMELLSEALSGTAGWDMARADRVLASSRTTSAVLARSIPVRLHYTTAIVEGGQVIMRQDIYGLDAQYARAMERAPAQRLATSEGGAQRGTTLR